MTLKDWGNWEWLGALIGIIIILEIAILYKIW